MKHRDRYCLACWVQLFRTGMCAHHGSVAHLSHGIIQCKRCGRMGVLEPGGGCKSREWNDVTLVPRST